jgi:16S rRNA processing protein RimM
MKKLDYQYLGEFIKLYSFKGEIILYSEIESDIVEQLDSIFVNFNESHVPFKIVKLKSHKKNIYRSKLENIESEDDAKKFINKSVYIEKTEKINDGDNVDNFKIYDKDKYVGVVISTYKKTGQTLIEVKMSEKTILIPLVDELIKQISYEEQKIKMILPEGLLDI